jgi:hypothetical protein
MHPALGGPQGPDERAFLDENHTCKIAMGHGRWVPHIGETQGVGVEDFWRYSTGWRGAAELQSLRLRGDDRGVYRRRRVTYHVLVSQCQMVIYKLSGDDASGLGIIQPSAFGYRGSGTSSHFRDEIP